MLFASQSWLDSELKLLSPTCLQCYSATLQVMPAQASARVPLPQAPDASHFSAADKSVTAKISWLSGHGRLGKSTLSTSGALVHATL